MHYDSSKPRLRGSNISEIKRFRIYSVMFNKVRSSQEKLIYWEMYLDIMLSIDFFKPNKDKIIITGILFGVFVIGFLLFLLSICVGCQPTPGSQYGKLIMQISSFGVSEILFRILLKLDKLKIFGMLLNMFALVFIPITTLLVQYLFSCFVVKLILKVKK